MCDPVVSCGDEECLNSDMVPFLFSFFFFKFMYYILYIILYIYFIIYIFSFNLYFRGKVFLFSSGNSGVGVFLFKRCS